MPPQVREICRTLSDAGYEAWCVGGAVRDALLGRRTLDWDIATSAKPDEVRKLFRRTIPVGIEFGTVGVLDCDGVLHEVTTFRHDIETDGRHAVVKFGASLQEDLARRDFTINAIALHPETGELRDPFDGQGDLARGIVRCVGVPAERFYEDRLRALRALRFAGRFGFSIEPKTWKAVCDSAPHLGRLSMERVKQELDKIMEQVKAPAETMERYRSSGAFGVLIPSLADAPPERFAALDYLAMPGLARRPERKMTRLAALFVEPGVAPPHKLDATLKALRFSNMESRTARTLAESAGKISLEAIGSPIADAALRRLIASVGRLMVPSLSRLLWARARANDPQKLSDQASAGAEPILRTQGISLYRRALKSAWNDPLTVADLAVDGEDIKRAGITNGREIGQVLNTLMNAVLDDPTQNTHDQLVSLVNRIKEGRADTTDFQ